VLRQINATIVNIGIPGSGKSIASIIDAKKLALEHECEIVIHDAGGSGIRNREHFRDAFAEYDNPAKSLHFFRRIHVLNTGRAEDVFLLAEKARKRAGGKVVIVVDEVTLCDAISASSIGEPWLSAIAQRRWKGYGFVFVLQDPTMAPRRLTGLATQIRLFRLTHSDHLKAAKKMGFSDAQLAEVPTLSRGESVELSPGF